MPASMTSWRRPPGFWVATWPFTSTRPQGTPSCSPARSCTATTSSLWPTPCALRCRPTTTAVVKDAVETLATKNVPRLGETYVCFVSPHQSRQLRDDPEYIEVTKYAAPGNFMLGEIGRLSDCVFIETTQVYNNYVSSTSG